MALAKSALELFIRSLPRACKVTIIGFGTNLDVMSRTGDEMCVFDLNDENRDFMIKKIQAMESDLGGTDLMLPFRKLKYEVF